MPNRQHSRRRTTQRLLLLTAAGVAGIGISLALDKPAHANDLTPNPRDRPVTDIGALLRHSDKDQPAPPGGTIKAVPHKPGEAKPRPVLDVARTVDTTLDRAARTVTHASRQVDRTVEQLPVPAGAVDEVTNLTARVIRTTTTGQAALPNPPAVDVRVPPTVGALLPGGGQPTPKTAPELAGAGSPKPLIASSGAPIPPGTTWQHPAAGRSPAVQQSTAGVESPTLTRPFPTPLRHLATAGGDVQAAAPTVKHGDGAIADRWIPADRWQQNIIRHMHNHTGRTPPPKPPSG